MISFEEQLQLEKSAKQINEYLSVSPLGKDKILLFSIGSDNWYPTDEWAEEFRTCIRALNIEGLLVGKAHIDKVITMDYDALISLRDELNKLIAQEEKGRIKC